MPGFGRGAAWPRGDPRRAAAARPRRRRGRAARRRSGVLRTGAASRRAVPEPAAGRRGTVWARDSERGWAAHHGRPPGERTALVRRTGTTPPAWKPRARPPAPRRRVPPATRGRSGASGRDGESSACAESHSTAEQHAGARPGTGEPLAKPPTLVDRVVGLGTATASKLPGPARAIATQTLRSVGATVDRILDPLPRTGPARILPVLPLP